MSETRITGGLAVMDDSQTPKVGPRNAFQILLDSQKKKMVEPAAPKSEAKADRKRKRTYQDYHYNDRDHHREALGRYTENPELFDGVIYHNDDFVVVHDSYPKSAIHLLILPRDPTKQRLHPFDAFEDAAFTEKCKSEVAKVTKLAAAELRRQFGQHSRADRARNEALDADDVNGELPPGRNWEADIMSGIHSGPSMSHLHIHVLSRDRVNECMKHRKHYNSFETPFFVHLEDFPLAENDPRRDPEKRFMDREYLCWKCKKNFGKKFAELKKHLDLEFQDWLKQ